MDLLDTTDWRTLVKLRLAETGLLQRDLAVRVHKSEGWMSQVLSGIRDLDPEVVTALGEALGLDAEGTEYLSALVDLHNGSPRARRAAFASVQAKQRQRASPELRQEVLLAMSRWYVPAILEIALCDGFRMDPVWLAAVLSPPITVAEAQEALTALLRLRYLETDEAGLVVAARDLFTPSVIPKGERSELIATAHRASLKLATDALAEFHDTERHHGSLTMALSEEQFERLRARLHEVEQEFALLASEDAGVRNRIYRLQFQVFPLSLFSDAVPPGYDDQSIEDSNQGPPPDIDPATTV